MKYALLSMGDEVVYAMLEREDEPVAVYSENEREQRTQQRGFDALNARTIRDAMGSGFSYYQTEVGEYEDDKAKVDKIIAGMQAKH